MFDGVKHQFSCNVRKQRLTSKILNDETDDTFALQKKNSQWKYCSSRLDIVHSSSLKFDFLSGCEKILYGLWSFNVSALNFISFFLLLLSYFVVHVDAFSVNNSMYLLILRLCWINAFVDQNSLFINIFALNICSIRFNFTTIIKDGFFFSRDITFSCHLWLCLTV